MKRRLRVQAWLAVLGLIALVLFTYTAVENRLIAVRDVTLTHPDLPAAFAGYTIVQVTDLHGRVFGERESALIARIRSISPDLVLLTGDYVLHAGDTSPEAVEPVLDLVRGLVPDIPCAFVLGNYEGAGEYSFYPPGDGGLADLLTSAGALHIYPALRIDRGADHIWLSDWSRTPYSLPGLAWPGSPAFPSTLRGGNDFIIAVTHRPLDLESPSAKRSALDPRYVGMAGTLADGPMRAGELSWKINLAGHTHGGQVRLPLIGPLTSPNDKGFLWQLFPRKGDRYVLGTWTDARGRVRSISSGLGASGPWGLRFRFDDTPELLVLHLAGG
jgi:uncharacterized protein